MKKYGLTEISAQTSLNSLSVSSSDQNVINSVLAEIENKFNIKKKQVINGSCTIDFKSAGFNDPIPCGPALIVVKNYLLNNGWEPFQVVARESWTTYCFRMEY